MKAPRTLRRVSGDMVLVLAPLALSLAGCRSTAGPRLSETELLASWMTGSFSSTAQSQAQPERFFDIRLFMVPIWTDRADGPWLYVEQAARSALEKPYRQRVYHLIEAVEGVRSDVYELPGDPLEYAGAWTSPEIFDAFGPDALSEREGCSIHLARREDGMYTGSTVGVACRSSLRGASYATSDVVITPQLLTSWDRGFGADGRQVWGATAGPYAFVKEMPQQP